MYHDDQGILTTALELIFTLEPELIEIVLLSLKVSITAVALATIISIPLGTLLGAYRFRGRDFITGILNALMGLPLVVVGLALTHWPARQFGTSIYIRRNDTCPVHINYAHY